MTTDGKTNDTKDALPGAAANPGQPSGGGGSNPSTAQQPKTYTEEEVNQRHSKLDKTIAELTKERDGLKAGSSDLAKQIETLTTEKTDLQKQVETLSAQAPRPLHIDSGMTNGGGVDVEKLSSTEKIKYGLEQAKKKK
jgi:hypothetical protein